MSFTQLLRGLSHRRPAQKDRTVHHALRATPRGRRLGCEPLEERTLLTAVALDPSFDLDGRVTTDFLGSGRDYTDPVVIQPDGKIVVAGSTGADGGAFAIARYTSAGELDTSFDGDGQVTTDFGPGTAYARAVDVQSDGKIVVAGRDGSSHTAIARYNPDGSLDTTFDSDGRVVSTDYGPVEGMAIDGSGRIVVVGSAQGKFMVARYATTGGLDGSFGTAGSVNIDFGFYAQAYDVVIQSDGKILVAGYGRSGPAGDYDFVLARYTSGGALDDNFDVDGVATIDFSGDGSQDYARGIAIDSMDRIVVAGYAYNGSNYDFAVARCTDTGALDTDFHADGKVMTDLGKTERGYDVAIGAGDKIAVAGLGPGTYSPHYPKFCVLRYEANGDLDGSFDSDGVGPIAFHREATGLAIDGSDRIVAVGWDYSSTNFDFAIARFTTAGALDTDFDSDGKVTTDFLGHVTNTARDVAIDSEGRIVVVGNTSGLLEDFALARYLPDGSLDGTFGTGGKVTTDLNYTEWATGVAIQSDGKIVVAGESGYGRLTLARYNIDGSLDDTFSGDGKIDDALWPLYSAHSSDAAIQPVDKGDGTIEEMIVVACRGYPYTDPQNYDLVVVRYDSTGVLDTSFGQDLDGDGIPDGITAFDFSTAVNDSYEEAKSIAVDSQGRIIAIGLTRGGLEQGILVARLDPDGTPDTTFGTTGDGTVITTNFGYGGNNPSVPYNLAIDSDDKIVVVGGGGELGIARYTTDGTLDPSFDGDGTMYTLDMRGSNADVGLDGEDRIVVGGYASPSGQNDFALKRFNPDGSEDPSFNDGETVVTDFASASDMAYGVAIQPNDGKIVLVGSSDSGQETGIDFAVARYELQDAALVDLSGQVFDDRDNDGLYEPGDGDVGIGGVTVKLFDQATGESIASQTTGSDGTYVFADLGAGTYFIRETQPAHWLDGKETAGELGGSVDNTQDANEIRDIVIGPAGTIADAAGYNFAEILPSDIQGMVWEDFNDDGGVNFSEKAIPGVSVTLTGTDDRGNAIDPITVTTDDDGIYMFIDLRPSGANDHYTITETQPDATLWVDAKDVVGEVNGTISGDNDGGTPALSTTNDQFTTVVLPDPGSVGINYNFGERPAAQGVVTPGQTATIGFWQNNNGQALLTSLNGSEENDQLGDWLAATFPNMYSTLNDASNVAVADFYSNLFLRKKKEAEKLGLTGPTKMDAQIMGVAFACYVTNETLAGSVATGYGFLVTEYGVGASNSNVDAAAADAFDGLSGDVAILDLLFATDRLSWNGVLYDLDHDGETDDTVGGLSETLLRTLANDVYSAINEAGDI